MWKYLLAMLLLLGCSAEVGVGGAPPRDLDAAAPLPPAPADDTTTPDAEPAQEAETEESATLKLANRVGLPAYLTDASGRTLYMYAGDLPSSRDTACLDACARAWPPFDVPELRAGAGIDPRDVSRYHRQDGAFQVTYKGHPLYLRAGEAPDTVSGDGAEGRWFVARDYLAFLSLPVNFQPAADGPPSGTILTDGFGRTLYVCLDDEPAQGSTPPRSSCVGPCVATRPPFAMNATQRTTLLPSILSATDLRAFTRSDGAVQLTYRGWPLYYSADDLRVGDTIGHNQKAWRAIDPIAFARGGARPP